MIHRDLAARNVLVDSSYVCKVADFGLSRKMRDGSHYYKPLANGALPIRWTAVEILLSEANEQRFDEKTDVWSFAILMHEIYSDGGTPYPHLSNQVLAQSISEG